MKKLIAFDLDGTLAPSKSPMSDRIGELLNQLLERFEVCVISGGKFEQFEKQLLNNLKASPQGLAHLHLMPTCGTRYFIYSPARHAWEKIYAEDFTEDQKQKITEALRQALKALGLEEKKLYGEIIEDRGSQVTLSTLGQDVVDVLGLEGVRIKEAWDPDNAKKQAIVDYVTPLIPEFEAKVGGLTSVDVTKPGIDKAYGMKKLMEALEIGKDDILFMGDRLIEGGNDYPVKAMGIDTIAVPHWEGTALAVEAILAVTS
jgi:phosphomannomutase